MEDRSSKRLQWADRAKGIGILAVIAAHTSLDFTWWGVFINSFHIPLFFFLSGFFFSAGKYGSASLFIRRKARSLLLPYAVFAGGSYLYFLARYHFGSSEYYEGLSPYRQFFGIFYSAGIREWMDFNIPLWFLTCLFVVEFAFYACQKRFRTKAALIAVLALCSGIGYLDSVWNPYKLPWGIDVAATAVVFYGAGHLLKAACIRLLALPIVYRLALAVLFLALHLASLTRRMNVNMKEYGHYYDFYFAAFCGIAWCLLLSSLIRMRTLNYLGRNALILMAVHMLLLGIASRLAGYVPFLSGFYASEVFRIGASVLLAVPFIGIVRRHFPWIAGEKGGMSASRRLVRESEMTSPSNTTIT